MKKNLKCEQKCVRFPISLSNTVLLLFKYKKKYYSSYFCYNSYIVSQILLMRAFKSKYQGMVTFGPFLYFAPRINSQCLEVRNLYHAFFYLSKKQRFLTKWKLHKVIDQWGFFFTNNFVAVTKKARAAFLIESHTI